MNEHDDMDEIERIARDALHARADQVEPSPNAYARLADKVAGAADRPTPWWQSPRLLWLGAACATAAVVAIAMLVTFADDDGDDETAISTETPTPAAEATLQPVDSPTPAATPRPAPALTGEPTGFMYPYNTSQPYLQTADAAAKAFYTELLGLEEPSLREVEASDGDSNQVVFNVLVDPDSEILFSEATIRTVEIATGEWAVVGVTGGHLAIDDAPGGAIVTARQVDGISIRTIRAFTILVIDPAQGVVRADPITVERVEPETEVSVPLPEGSTPGGELLVIAYFSDGGAGAATARWFTSLDELTEDPTPTPIGAQGNVGRPEGVIWPVEEIQPFGEWPESPEAAAQNFVTSIAGWTLPVGDVTFLDPILMIADVELRFTDESGEPFGVSTTVRVIGGFDDNGVPNWGVQWARSERIQVFRVFTLDNEFLVTGDGVGFEGVVEVRLVDANANVAGEGFFTGGAFELAPLEGTVPITENFPGPGFAILFDVGGLGVSPSALTIVPIVLEELDEPDAGAGSCSAEGLEPPTPDPDLPEAVEATRQAIAAAAIACDWEALEALIDPSQFSFSFGADTDAITFWQEVDRDFGGEPMRFLVETLKLNWTLDDQTGATPISWYIWPDAFPMIWEDVTPEMREALRPLYDDQDFEGFENIGGFAGYRLAITDTGDWLYFIAGD